LGKRKEERGKKKKLTVSVYILNLVFCALLRLQIATPEEKGKVKFEFIVSALYG